MVTARRSRLGQTGTEYMLIISVLTISVVGAAYTFVTPFERGVNKLGNDVAEILGGQSIGGVGRGSGGGIGDTVNGGTNNMESGPASGSPAGSGPGLGTPAGDNTSGAPSLNNRIQAANDQLASDTRSQDQINFQNLMNGQSTGSMIPGMTQTASAPILPDGTEIAERSPMPREVADLRRGA